MGVNTSAGPDFLDANVRVWETDSQARCLALVFL